MNMTAGLLRYSPTGHADWEKPTAVFFVESLGDGQWIVAIPVDADQEVAVSVRTALGHQEPVEFMIITEPTDFVSAPPRGAVRFDFETRPNDSLDPAQVAGRVPRSLAPPIRALETQGVPRATPSEMATAEIAALTARLQALETASGRAEGPEARRLFGPPMRTPVAVDAEQARRLAGPAPEILGRERSRASRRPSEPAPRAEPVGSVEGRIVNALEALVAVKQRAQPPEVEDREEGDVAGAVTTGGGKGITRLRTLAERYARAPGRRWDHITQVASDAGQDTVTNYMETCTQMRRDRLTAYLVSLFCRIAAAAEEGDLERVLGRCASGLIFCDQWSIDGNVQLAWQMALEPEPAVLRRHPETPLTRAFPKGNRRAPFPQQQFSQLAEPQVTEAALAATKNWKEFREAAEKLQE